MLLLQNQCNVRLTKYKEKSMIIESVLEILEYMKKTI